MVGTRSAMMVVVLAVSISLAAIGNAAAGPVVEVLPSAFTDVPSGEHYPIFNYLGALRIISGERGLGGPIRPLEPMTRAELAAIIVHLAAEQDMALGFMDQVPAFSDGPEVPRWAWGVVGAIAELGLMRGYPDGSFKPYEIVTQGEALTVMARLLGWEPEPWGEWDGYVGRAVKGGLAGRLRLDLIERAPAYRHEVAHMGFMALTARPDRTNERLFDRQFTAIHGVFESCDLEAGTAVIGGETYDLAGRVVLSAGSDIHSLTGHPLRAVLDREGRVLYLDPLVGL